MPDINIMEHIDESGNFTDSFKDQIVSIAGEEFKDTKVFDDVPGVTTLIKNHLETKAMVGKKLENIIQLPAEDASDEDKATAVKAAQKFLGATENADDYEFPREDGLEYNEQSDTNEKTFREFFLSRGVSPALAKELVEMSNQAQVAGVEAHLATETKEFETASTALKADWTGDSLVENARTAHNAIMEFGGDIKFGEKPLTELLKEVKIYDDAGNLDKWNNSGVNPAQLALWYRIGVKMKSAEPPQGEDEVESKGSKGDKSDLVGPGKHFDHPTSAELNVKRD